MALTVAGANLALGAITGTITMSIHTGAPGDSGAANEVSGGGYARQTITLSAASARTRTLSNTPVFNIPGSTTISHYAIWAGATCVDVGALNASQAFSTAGTYTVNSGSISIG